MHFFNSRSFMLVYLPYINIIKLRNCLHNVFFDLFFIVILWPSSRFQVILGSGLPLALHANVAFSPSFTVISDMVSSSLMSGGTMKKKLNWLYYYDRVWTLKVLIIKSKYWFFNGRSTYKEIIHINIQE